MALYNKNLDLSTAMGEDIPLRTPKHKKKKRDCLSCHTKFESHHKFNRICETCKDKQAKDSSGYPVDYAGVGGTILISNLRIIG